MRIYRKMHYRVLGIAAGAACAGALVPLAAGQSASAPALQVVPLPAEVAGKAGDSVLLSWPGNYDAALAAAHEQDKPLLVVVGAAWCQACHDLDAQLKDPAVRQELAALDTVYVDFDANRDLAKKLGIGPIPALRLIKPSGRTAAVYDGVMPAAALASWLHDSAKAAAEEAFDPALDADDLSDAAVATLVGMFGNSDETLREAAIRRLLPHRDKAAAPVVDAFSAGNLSVRLTALDLLDSWQAPVAGVDPWRPETVTPERLASLKKWSLSPGPAAQTAPALDEKQRAQARDLLTQYMQADDTDAAVLRERLARYGAALLPDVYAALKDAASDQLHARLTFLRYRLAASDVLALQWPAGIERLASMDIKTRRSALPELSDRVTSRDTGLLLELFSDADPLVRETALRLLQKVGGPSATDALAGLLQDPDPNVRAAVLKAVAEEPTPQIVQKVADYIAREKDTDLIVHGVRVLRNAKGAAAIKTLYGLLDHASWRVRAEAIEALQEKVGPRADVTAAQQADFYVRMLQMLDDADGYVASRALSALEEAQGLPSVEKIAKTADKHPELAAMAVKIMANNLKSDPKGITYIRSYVNHKDPAVRAITIGELTAAIGDNAADDLHHALADPEERVRTAAADAIMRQLAAIHPENSGLIGNAAPVPMDTLLEGFQSGKTRPKWLGDLAPDLEKSLAAASKNEALHAAIPLIAMGFGDKALPRLKELTAADPAMIETGSEALIWLKWDERFALYTDFKAHAPAADFPRLIEGLAAGNDPRAADPLWKILADPKTDWSTADTVSSDLRQILLGSTYYGGGYGGGNVSDALTRSTDKLLAPYVNSGIEMQETVALVIMSGVDPVGAVAAAAKFADDPKSSPTLKHDMLQIQFSLLDKSAAEAAAAKLLTGGDKVQRDLALDVFTGNDQALRYLHDDIYLQSAAEIEDLVPSGTPITPRPPKALTAEMVRPLLNDPDPRVAADAGYLLALFKDKSGMDKLLDYYRKNATDQDAVCRLVYRAISALDDDSYTPILTEIYKTLAKSGPYNLREFYWTIRSMSGEKCMDLRKRIRDEMGMDALR